MKLPFLYYFNLFLLILYDAIKNTNQDLIYISMTQPT